MDLWRQLCRVTRSIAPLAWSGQRVAGLTVGLVNANIVSPFLAGQVAIGGAAGLDLEMAGVEVPEDDACVLAGRGEAVAIRAEGDACDAALVPLQGGQRLPAVDVPKDHGLVVAG